MIDKLPVIVLGTNYFIVYSLYKTYVFPLHHRSIKDNIIKLINMEENDIIF